MSYDFSIVVPVYNESLLVSSALSKICHSLVKSNFLLVVVDNGSNDDTLSKVFLWKNSNPKINFKIISENSVGALHAKRTGILYAKKFSKIVVSLDIDCQPLKGFEDDILDFCSSKADVLFGFLRQDQETRLLKYVFLPNLMNVIASLENLEKELYGQFFFGGFFAIKSERVNENIFSNDNIPMETEASIFWSRRCYYSGLIFKNSNRTVRCSSRRFWDDPYGFFSSKRDAVIRSSIPGYSEKILLIKKLAKNEDKIIESKLNSFTFRILMLLLDLIFFEKSNSKLFLASETIDKICLYFDLPKIKILSLTNMDFLTSKKKIYDSYKNKVFKKCFNLIIAKNNEKI